MITILAMVGMVGMVVVVVVVVDRVLVERGRVAMPPILYWYECPDPGAYIDVVDVSSNGCKIN